jgi:hypothetical protein
MGKPRKLFHSSLTKNGGAVTDGGGLGQRVLHKSNGEICQERTYGEYPGRLPG